jgi:hypothetical protein
MGMDVSLKTFFFLSGQGCHYGENCFKREEQPSQTLTSFQQASPVLTEIKKKEKKKRHFFVFSNKS